MSAADSASEQPVVSVVVPARNEEATLRSCLQSIVEQEGVSFEVIVVDDSSSDRTREIARSFSIVRVIDAGPLPPDWTGKNNAMAAGACEARGKWVLFTDADTVHKPGSLARAVAEAEEHGAALLSYSPEQEVHGFWEKAVMPVIFAELARTYRPRDVCNPKSPVAAANGQYLMIRREAYEAVGGHAAISDKLLEDVALARLVKASGRRLRFRYGADAVRTRMYRSFAQMKEGWTKNLALLFRRPALHALVLLMFWAFSWLTFILGLAAVVSDYWSAAYYFLPLCVLYGRIAWGRFAPAANLVAIAFGMPLAAYLLFRSANLHANGVVSWKGRKYRNDARKTSRSVITERYGFRRAQKGKACVP
jgi:glycosyltransferase involved in cell wall biosynthesis